MVVNKAFQNNVPGSSSEHVAGLHWWLLWGWIEPLNSSEQGVTSRSDVAYLKDAHDPQKSFSSWHGGLLGLHSSCEEQSPCRHTMGYGLSERENCCFKAAEVGLCVTAAKSSLY